MKAAVLSACRISTGEAYMRYIVLVLKVWRDTRGQDLIEYALMAGFVAVSAAAAMPSIVTSISTVFSQVGSVLSVAAAS